MKAIWIIVLTALAGCTTASSDTSSKTKETPVNALPAQSLEPGECGLFGWTTDAPPRFIFFVGPDGAKLFRDGQIEMLNPYESQAFPPTKFVDFQSSIIDLTLGEGDALDGGTRYPQARLKYEDAEGWTKLQPLAILTSCQPG